MVQQKKFVCDCSGKIFCSKNYQPNLFLYVFHTLNFVFTIYMTVSSVGQSIHRYQSMQRRQHSSWRILLLWLDHLRCRQPQSLPKIDLKFAPQFVRHCKLRLKTEEAWAMAFCQFYFNSFLKQNDNTSCTADDAEPNRHSCK